MTLASKIVLLVICMVATTISTMCSDMGSLPINIGLWGIVTIGIFCWPLVDSKSEKSELSDEKFDFSKIEHFDQIPPRTGPLTPYQKKFRQLLSEWAEGQGYTITYKKLEWDEDEPEEQVPGDDEKWDALSYPTVFGNQPVVLHNAPLDSPTTEEEK